MNRNSVLTTFLRIITLQQPSRITLILLLLTQALASEEVQYPGASSFYSQTTQKIPLSTTLLLRGLFIPGQLPASLVLSVQSPLPFMLHAASTRHHFPVTIRGYLVIGTRALLALGELALLVHVRQLSVQVDYSPTELVVLNCQFAISLRPEGTAQFTLGRGRVKPLSPPSDIVVLHRRVRLLLRKRL